MKKKRHIQVFIGDHRDNNCEVNAELVQFTENESGTVIHIVTKEEDGTLWEHFFPLHNVSMVRISQ